MDSFEDIFVMDEQEAANAVAALCGDKRTRDDSPDAAGGRKLARITGPKAPAPAVSSEFKPEDLKPAPFFYYKDYSTEQDPDPLTPLTPPGRVPNFPAKMHAILSRSDLSEIIAWDSNGRSWRVLKPREFEIRVIPTYFEHAKFSSFIRQANGWGFRRITQGTGRNSYYHPRFLRGLPHLCKQMKRPGVSQKQAADPDHEPDLNKISQIFPVPEKAGDESIMLQCTLQGGPKARMPIYTGVLSAKPEAKMPAIRPCQFSPQDQQALDAFQQSLGASEIQLQNMSFASPPVSPPTSTSVMQSLLPAAANFCMPSMAAPSMAPPPSNNNNNNGNNNNNAQGNKISPLMAANQLAFAGMPRFDDPAMAAAIQASQFAAGFAAAAALSQQHFQTMFGGFPGQQQQQQQGQMMPMMMPTNQNTVTATNMNQGYNNMMMNNNNNNAGSS